MSDMYVSRKVEVPKIDHHAYHVAGIDKNVLIKQAVARRDDYRGTETTVIHNHPWAAGRKVLTCNVGCTIYQKGFKTRSVAEVPVPEEEETDGTAGSTEV